MTVIGKMIKFMAKELKLKKINLLMLENFTKERNTALEPSPGRKAAATKELSS